MSMHQMCGRPLVFAAVCAALVVGGACAPSPADDSDGGGGQTIPDDEIASLTIAPTGAVLESIDGAEVSQAFTAQATLRDGRTVDLTTMGIFSVDGAYGRMTDATFVTTGTRAGVARVTVTYGAKSAAAEVTINVRRTRVEASAPAGAAGLFADGVTVDPARAPAIVYPPRDVTMPANIGDLDVHWLDTQANDVFRVRLSSPHGEVSVITSTPNWITFTAEEWAVISGEHAPVAVDVFAARQAQPGTIGAAPTQTITLTDTSIAGGLYYWAAATAAGPDAPYGIFRHDVSRAGEMAEPFYTTTETSGRCVACHVLSRDGSRMAVTYDGGNGQSGLLDVATREVVPGAGAWNFGTFTADGQSIITVSNGVFTVRDATSGAPQATLTTSGLASHPDMSDDGTTMVYVQYPGGVDWSFTGGTLMIAPYDAATRSLGVSVPLVVGPQNNFYPSLSPGGDWVLFNRSNESSYDAVGAELWAVAATGGVPVQLTLANQSVNLTNSWARWAPFAQTVNGEPLYWVTFSSKRAFGVRMPAGTRPQIWMAPFFPMRALAGQDPSGPAFRLPYQALDTSNHIAQWAERIVTVD